jgi:hypothetical protein
VRLFAYALPLLAFPADAMAWGLQTHLFFAQYVLLLVPLADPELRRALARLPGLVLAGACLPDLALAGKALGTPAFRRAHRWSTLRRLAAAPRDDHDRALAVGYASHLLCDVVAHNRFVPEHEARIVRIRHATHALAEWAMDHYVCAQVYLSPSEVLDAERERLIDFVAHVFRCGEPLAGRALRLLSRADGLLRASPVPALCQRVVSCFHRDMTARFDAYLRDAAACLPMLEAALTGGLVDWVNSDPEGSAGNAAADARAGHDIAWIVQAEHDA